MHKPQKKHNEIRGYVKRVFMPEPSRRFITAKKQGLKKTSAFVFL